MEDRAVFIQSASIFVASLPIIFFLLPSQARSWLVARATPRRKSRTVDQSERSRALSTTVDETRRSRQSTEPQAGPQDAYSNKTPSTPPPVVKPPPAEPTIQPPGSPSTPKASTQNTTSLPNSAQNSAITQRTASQLMPPPPRPTSTPNRTAALLRTSPQSTRQPTLTANQPTTSTLPSTSRPRKKVILSPGHSPLDWAHLTSSTPPHILSGVPYPQRVTPRQLAQMNGRKGRPAWSVFKGRVYNIGPYMEFHPGGVGELRRGAGKVADALFEEVHPWVNVEGMLGACLVGFLVQEEEEEEEEEEKGMGLEGLD